MQPCVITAGLVGLTRNIYNMMQLPRTARDTITVTLDTAIVIVVVVLGVQHHPAATKHNSFVTPKQIHTQVVLDMYAAKCPLLVTQIYWKAVVFLKSLTHN
jgi:hypothetical protein